MLWSKRIDLLEQEVATLRAELALLRERTNNSISSVEDSTKFVVFKSHPRAEYVPMRRVVQMILDHFGLRLTITEAVPSETKLVKSRRVA